MRTLLLLPLALACATSNPPTDSPDAATLGDCESGVVRFTTDDGVTLEADLTASENPRGAVVLLHMIPPSNDRTNYPADFRDQLASQGFNVLNVDRRGAGASEGVATEAYTGPSGKLDVKAAIAFLRNNACASTEERIALVGASNGTTSVLDFTAQADIAPLGIAFLTGGSYTENQTNIAQTRSKLDPLPMLYAWDTNETPADNWATPLRQGAPASWSFETFAGAGHGTRMLSTAAAKDALTTWLVGLL